MTDYGALPI